MWEEHLWEAAAAEVQIGIPRSSMEAAADESGAEVAQTLEGASPEDQAIFSADSVEGKASRGFCSSASFVCAGVWLVLHAQEVGVLHAYSI